MSRDWRLYLDDIVEYAERALRYTGGMTYEQFLADTRTYAATLRRLEIGGEAVRKLPVHVRELAPTLPWGQIAGKRHNEGSASTEIRALKDLCGPANGLIQGFRRAFR